MQTFIVILIVAIAAAFLIRKFLKTFKQERRSAAAGVRPAPRIRLPVKKIRKTPSWVKSTGCTEMLHKPQRHKEHKERYLKLGFKIFVNFVPLW